MMGSIIKEGFVDLFVYMQQRDRGPERSLPGVWFWANRHLLCLAAASLWMKQQSESQLSEIIHEIKHCSGCLLCRRTECRIHTHQTNTWQTIQTQWLRLIYCQLSVREETNWSWRWYGGCSNLFRVWEESWNEKSLDINTEETQLKLPKLTDKRPTRAPY